MLCGQTATALKIKIPMCGQDYCILAAYEEYCIDIGLKISNLNCGSCPYATFWDEEDFNKEYSKWLTNIRRLVDLINLEECL